MTFLSCFVKHVSNCPYLCYLFGMKKPAPAASSRKPAWTFLSNHGHVLLCLHSDPDLPVKEIALRVGITERAVHRIITDLEEEGYIKRERVGRKNSYTFELNKQLRHPIEAHKKVKALLNLI